MAVVVDIPRVYIHLHDYHYMMSFLIGVLVEGREIGRQKDLFRVFLLQQVSVAVYCLLYSE